MNPNQLPPDIPPEAASFLQETGYFEPDRLKVGDVVPPILLTMLNEGTPVLIGDPEASRPTILIFGSYT